MLKRNLNKFTSTGRERNQQADADYDTMPMRSIDELLTDDKEVLGDHARGLFRDTARKKADKLIAGAQQAETVVNIKTTREKYLEARSNFTQVRIDKLKARIDNSPDNIFTRPLNNWRREKLHDLRAKNKKRSGALAEAQNKRLEKPEALRKEVDELVKKKVDAMYRKAQRIELHNRGIKRHNFVRRQEFLATLSPSDKKRIVGEAIRQARKKNIEHGRLSSGYEVDDVANENDVDIRKVTNSYGRVVE